MKIFETADYRAFIRNHIQSKQNQGRGEYRKLSEALSIHTTMTSQIFKGDKNLTPDQALSACKYFGFSEIETDYFLLLVDYARASSTGLKERLRKKIEQFQKESGKVKFHLKSGELLKSDFKREFYSQWYFSAIHLMTSIKKFQTVEQIQDAVKLPRQRIISILNFLVKCGLCQEEGGKYEMSVLRTHINADDPWVERHHLNWRVKSIEKLPNITDENLIFTAPVSISNQDRLKVREILLDAIAKISSTVAESKSEKLCGLNIDWFDVI